METLTLHPKTKKDFEVIKSIADALKIPYDENNTSPYNTAFVAKMERAAADKKAKRYRTIKTADLWK